MVSTFQLTRQTRLSLTHQEETERTEGEKLELSTIALCFLCSLLFKEFVRDAKTWIVSSTEKKVRQ
jgi:hypothetical protein